MLVFLGRLHVHILHRPSERRHGLVLVESLHDVVNIPNELLDDTSAAISGSRA
jgi:hypothetical protein